MSYFRHRQPMWFRLVAVVLVVWGAMGVYACYEQIRLGADAMGPASAYDRALYAALPRWYNPLFAIAVLAGLIGPLALLARSALARPLFVVSLVGIIVMFGWMFGATDINAEKGLRAAAGFPAVGCVIAVFQLWLAGIAQRRGWIG